MHLNLPSPIQKIYLNDRIGDLFVKRDDLIHPLLSGNKWRKLKYIVEGFDGHTLCTYGGAFSNHLLAVATFANSKNLQSKGLIRGEEKAKENPTLRKCAELGMELEFVDRTAYKIRTKNYDFKEENGQLLIPEGGSTTQAKWGMKEMLDEIRSQVESKNGYHFFCSYGTGGTAHGINNFLDKHDILTIVPAIKGLSMEQYEENAKNLDCKSEHYSIQYYEGMKNYAAKDMQLFHYCESFLEKFDILLDPIYTSKVMYYLDVVKQDRSLEKMVFIHTGGQQAWHGYFYRFPALREELPRIYEKVNSLIPL